MQLSVLKMSKRIWIILNIVTNGTAYSYVHVCEGFHTCTQSVQVRGVRALSVAPQLIQMIK